MCTFVWKFQLVSQVGVMESIKKSIALPLCKENQATRLPMPAGKLTGQAAINRRYLLRHILIHSQAYTLLFDAVNALRVDNILVQRKSTLN